MKTNRSTRAWLQCVLAMAFLPVGFGGFVRAADAPATILAPANTTVSNAVVRVRSIDDRHKDITYSGSGWTTFNPGSGWYNGTAKSSTVAKAFFEYANPSCTRLKWFCTKSNSRGKADVYVDGVLKSTVDTYSATDQPTSAVFDSGELPLGRHALKVVVTHQKSAAASDYWVECDKVEVVTTETLAVATPQPAPTPIPGAVIVNDSDGSVLCFGNWETETDRDGFHSRDYHACNVQYNYCEFKFTGSAVRWYGSKNKDHGFADVYLDGALQKTVDAYNPAWICNVVLFEKTGLSAGPCHTLRIVVRKDRNPNATDCYQDIDCFEAIQPVNYVEEITKDMRTEYAQIESGAKPYAQPDTWKPVSYAAQSPTTGVSLHAGVLNDAFQRNIDYLNHCFASKTYCDGQGWFGWLPASNEGRLLQGAANSLRWGERADLRNIVDTVVSRIQARQRADGYHNYYPEKDSFACETGGNSERKNYDRVFWTRGLLDAGRAGNAAAYTIVRKFYDWFNGCSYLPRMIIGCNSPNGFPGGPLVYLSPVGTSKDLIVSERFFDQEYWMRELRNQEPLCFTFYPGERPHCYDLLGLEAYIDEYRATGAPKYLDTVLGGWSMYKDNFEHVGGTTAICEANGPYPPKSYKITTGCTGETCGSVFWANINSRLMQLYPTREKYANEIEKEIYNVVLACQDAKGYIRYHNRLHGTKDTPQCQGTCCECSVVGMLAKLPEYIYSTDKDGLFVNLYAASTITWNQGGSSVTLTQTTSFPNAADVTLTVGTPTPKEMNIRIRVPSWAAENMDINVNGKRAATARPGSYASIRREWADNDVVSFTLPMGFKTIKYTGLDQATDNVDRYFLLKGPILLALNDANGRIHADSATLPSLLTPVEDSPLHYEVKGTAYQYLPYWQVTSNFTCFPMVQP
ncbi:MAG: glycoside hydrolase family 127 protein [Candidatus Omnitrophica bacterium]|nr:glycoside hydrolase family 127 protein [Candidatus Omnitrophota bacterium]